MLNVNHLRIFYYTAKNLSFTLAAKELLISPSAVINQIKAFENYLDLKLFIRKKPNIYLTEEGKTVFKYAETLFNVLGRLEHAIEDMKTLKTGVLRIAAPGASKAWMASTLDFFQKSFPEIKINAIEGSSEYIAHLLLANEVDIGFVSKLDDNPEITYIPVITEEIHFIVNQKHPLAHKTSIAIKELAGEPIVLKPAGSGTRKMVIDLFEQSHCEPNIILEISNADRIKEIVRANDFGAFMMKHELDMDNGELISVPIKGDKILKDICIAFSNNPTLSLPAIAFLKCFAELEPSSNSFPWDIDKSLVYDAIKRLEQFEHESTI